ncbi:hypothetical protein [Mycolicibacterium poriferae]|jgi:hypothetical protein|uniref:hypothetical protein n=1 Tax=Mycolicibacterium poriferae TaxID=39694 RepID=UPI0024BA65EF|nr:hypothetical protein [Mycolicibacterium poriferae]
MTEAEMNRRVALIRACLHVRAHYLDDRGNRLCFGCDAFVKAIDGVPIVPAPRSAA